MKRILAFLMTLAFILTLAIPLQASGAAMDQSLENAIKIAKTKFTIPADYKFTSSINMEGTRKVFYLNWNSSDTVNQKSINVNIDDKGMILNYYTYSPDDYVIGKKLPALSRQDAKEKADEQIKAIDPALSSQLQYEENAQTNLMDSSYYFNYYRVVNGIPFYNDRVYVTVNRDTGKLLNFSRNWTDVASFPALADIKTLDQAQEAYKTKLGLKLIYKYSYNYTDNKIKTYAVYTPVYENSSYAVDAVTGERVQIGYTYYGGMYFSESAAQSTKAGMGVTFDEVNLNPDELKAVEDAAKLKTAEDVEKIARAAKYTGITDEFKLSGSNLGTGYPDRTKYVWNLNFNKEDKENPNASLYASVTIDANTGEITNFYRGVPYNPNAKAQYDQAASKAAVDAFLSQNFPEYYKQVKYDELGNRDIVYATGAEKPQNYYFTYNRIVNGIAFPDNGVNINYDAVNGTVTSFNLNWLDTEFPAVDKAIPADTAYAKLFADIGLGLEYKVKVPAASTDAKTIAPVAQGPVEVLPAYALKPGKTLFLDAFTGGLLDYDGDPYKEVKPVSYTDIKDNDAEKQIQVLADNGVYLDGTEFKPDANITQKDFLTLVSKTMSYYGPLITSKSTAQDIDQLYAYLTREGVVKEGEKAPEAVLTNEDGVKFILRAMKLDKAADLKDVYICDFKDKGDINPSLTGYIVLAEGFKIIAAKDGYVYPKNKLTRADAAVMIYNYLQV